MIMVGDVYRARDFQGRLIKVMEVKVNCHSPRVKLLISDVGTTWIHSNRIKSGLVSGKLSTVGYGNTITPSYYLKSFILT